MRKFWGKAAYRCELSEESDVVLTAAEFERAVKSDELSMFVQKKRRRIGVDVA